MNSSCTTFWVLGALFSSLCAALIWGETSYSQAPSDPAFKTREYMIEISRQLGVTCTHCHNLKDFKSQEKKPWAISKKHIDLVKALNTNHKDLMGFAKADCYLCHRGKLVPDYKEVITNTD